MSDVEDKGPFSAVRDEAANASSNRQQPRGREYGDSKTKVVQEPHEWECQWNECNRTIGCRNRILITHEVEGYHLDAIESEIKICASEGGWGSLLNHYCFSMPNMHDLKA